MGRKYFISHKDRLYPASSHNLLALISDSYPEIKEKIKFRDLRCLDTDNSSNTTGYDLITNDIIQEQFVDRFSPEKVSLHTQKNESKSNKKSPEYQGILYSSGLKTMHLPDEQIKHLIESEIETIENIRDEQITSFLDSIYQELIMRETIIEPNVERIYQSKRQQYVYKNLSSALDSTDNIFYHDLNKSENHQEKYSKNDNVNEMIQQDIDAKNIEYEINKVKKEFFSRLLENVFIFYPENELYTKLINKLTTCNLKIKKHLITILDNIHNNEQMTENEKIINYLLILSDYKNNADVKKLLQEYFFADNKLLLVQYLTFLSKEVQLFPLYHNLGEVILQHLAEQKPSIYKIFMEYIRKDKAKVMDIHSISIAAHDLLGKINGNGVGLLFNFSLKDEIKAEINLLKDLDKFYLGKSSIFELKDSVKAIIKDAYQISMRNNKRL